MSRPDYVLFEKDRELTVSDGTPIRYGVGGPKDATGPAVALASGWSCSDAYWAHLYPHLAQRHRVLLPDTRGHGESGLPRPPGHRGRNITVDDMSVERIAQDLIELCRHEGVEQAVLVGHSMGVQTIFEAYRQAPRLVAGLVPIAGPYENPLKTFYNQSFFDKLWPIGSLVVTAIPSFVTAAWWRIGNNAAFGLKVAQLVGAAGPKVTKGGLAPYIAHLSTRDPAVLFKAIEGMRRNSAADLLPDVNVPVLIVAGGKDTFAPPSLQRHLHDVLPDSELLFIEEGCHTLPLEEPDAINDALDRFLERVRAGDISCGKRQYKSERPIRGSRSTGRREKAAKKPYQPNGSTVANDSTKANGR